MIYLQQIPMLSNVPAPSQYAPNSGSATLKHVSPTLCSFSSKSENVRKRSVTPKWEGKRRCNAADPWILMFKKPAADYQRFRLAAALPADNWKWEAAERAALRWAPIVPPFRGQSKGRKYARGGRKIKHTINKCIIYSIYATVHI